MAGIFQHAKSLLTRAKSQTLAPSTRLQDRADAAVVYRKAGNDALARGDLIAAVASYRLACEADPSDALALINLGFGLVEQGYCREAEEYLQRAAQLDPQSHDAHYMLARARIGQGNWEGAKRALVHALEQSPRSEFALRDLGSVHEQMGALDDALQSYERALLIAPSTTDAGIAGSSLARRMDNPERALEFSGIWVRAEAQSAAAWSFHAEALYEVGRKQVGVKPDVTQLTKALVACDKSLALDPVFVGAIYLRGNILMRLGHYDDALAAYNRVLELMPEHLDARINSGVAYRQLGQLKESMETFDVALAMAPDYAPLMQNRGVTLMDLCRAPEAIVSYQKGLHLDPGNSDIRWNLACAYLCAGEFEAGWAAFEHRFGANYLGFLPKQGALAQNYWKGESLQGRSIILFAEQGFGDSIQFLRYLPLVAQQASRVLVLIPEPLVVLAQSIPGNYEFVRAGAQIQRADFECSLMSLPAVFGMRLDNVPDAVPYLHAPSESLAHWRKRLGSYDGLRIGLVWSGSVDHKGDKHRSIALERLRSWATDGIQFVSLQKEIRPGDLEASKQWPELLQFGSELQTFADTAALIAQMDLVVSVDTSVAHLAGALGKPLWIMIPFAPDWRWMYERTDTPWYPTAKLYRQDESRSWEPVLARIQTDFMAMVRPRRTLERF